MYPNKPPKDDVLLTSIEVVAEKLQEQVKDLQTFVAELRSTRQPNTQPVPGEAGNA